MDTRARTNPFPGLRPFMQEEADLFFGRDKQSDELVRRLAGRRFLAVVGTSGSGKSSLVRAGLLPSLEGGFMAEAGAHWRIAILRPQDDPIGFLAQSIVETGVLAHLDLAPPVAESVVETTLRRSSLGLIEAARLARLEAHENLLIVVDQFEELFRFADLARQRGVPDEAPAFVKLLLEAARQTEVPVYVVITMRSDFLGDCARFRDLPEAISDSQYLIPRLTRDELQAVITGPIYVRGGRIAPSLVQRLLNDIGDDMDQLPVLQHALMRAWEHWERNDPDDRPIEMSDIEAIGGMAEALSRHADEAFKSLTTERDRKIAERLFKCLTERGPDNREIRRPTPLSRIAAIANADPTEVIRVIDVFRAPGRSFLMPPYDVDLKAATVIDISHESLIRQWSRLRTWVEEEAESRATYLRLVQAARLHRAGRAGLWGEPDLTYARQWQERETPNATWAERYGFGFDEASAFLGDSEAAHAAELEQERQQAEAEQIAKERELEQAKALAEAQRQRADEQAAARIRQRRLSWVLFGVLALAVGFALYGWRQRGAAEHQGKVALSRQFAAESQLVRNQRADFYSRALLLAVESMQRSPFPLLEADQALRSLLAVMPRPLTELEAPFDRDRLAFSADGNTVAWSDTQGTTKLWTVGTRPSEARALPDSAPVSYLDFSADGRYLVIGDHQRLRVWNVEGGRFVRDMALPTGGVAAAVSDEARYVAVLSLNGVVRVWTAADEPVTQFQVARSGESPGPGRFGVVRFSPGGSYLAAGAYNQVTVCPVGAWQRCGEPVMEGAFGLLSFSRDERLLAVLSHHETRVFTLGAIPALVFEAKQAGQPMALALSPDSSLLAISTSGAQGDLTTQVWNLPKKREAVRIPHGSDVLAISFSPDSTRLATAGADNTARVWDISTARELTRMVHGDRVIRVGFSDSGRQVVTASEDQRIRAWEAGAHAEVARLSVQPVEHGFQFTPDGVALVAAGGDESRGAILSRWRPSDGIIERSIEQGARTIHVSTDGHRLWAARGESAVAWDVDTMMPAGTFEHTPPIDWAAVEKRGQPSRTIHFKVERLRANGSVQVLGTSRDGEFVATTRADDTVRIWRMGSPRPVVSVQDPGPVTAVFGNAGHYVALISLPSVRIFQLPSGAEAGQITLASDDPQRVEFSADESLVAVVSRDNTLRVFDLPAVRERWGLTSAQDTRLVSFSPDGRFLATAHFKDYKVAIWQAGNGTPVGQPAVHDQPIEKLAFSHGGELVAMGTAGGQVILRQTRSGREVARLAHDAGITDLAFGADGSVLASTSKDGSTRLMDCRTGVEVARLAHGSVPRRVQFSPDAKYLATETDEGVQIWLWRARDMVDEACRRVPRDLSADEWRLYLGEESPTACRVQAR